MNSRLAAESAGTAFSFRYEDAGVILEGAFDAWSIAPNGSGEILHFHTPIKHGSAHLKASGKSWRLDGAIPLVQMQLAFIDGAHPGQQKSLVFNCSTVGSKPGDRTAGAVTVLDPDVSGRTDLDPLAKDLIVPALANCFVANRDKLAFVFADVALTPTENADWMVLRSVAYCYQQDQRDTLGNFGVLGMFGHLDISGYSKTFDSSLLRPGDDFGFILSGEQLLAHVVLPGLPDGFRGSSPGQFQLNGNRIVNNGQIPMQGVRVGLIWYSPHVNDLDVHIEGNYISTYCDGRCPIAGLSGAYIDFSMTEKEVASFDLEAEAFSFFPRDKNVTHSSYIPLWEKIIGAMFTADLLNVIAETIALILENAVGSLISGSGLDAAGLGAFQVRWHPEARFKLTDGGLQDNFYCRGKQQP